MKFLHTADWQIGMKAESLGSVAARVREVRMAAARRVVQTASERKVDFVVVAGDVFEDNGVDRVLVQRVVDILSGFEGPVFVIPGNHDPLTPGSVWEHPAWKSAANVQVLREAEPVELAGGVLFPCPVKEKHLGLDPTSWIPADQIGLMRIGLAYGTVEGVRQDEPDCPIPRDASRRVGLDYLALGHWHSVATYAGPEGTTPMAYCGSHEPTKFGERESGNVLIVEIAAPGVAPVVTPVRTGGRAWRQVERDVREPGDLARLRQELEGMDEPGSTLVDVRITGLLRAEEQRELDHVDQILASRFLWGQLDRSGLRVSPEDDRWMEGLPVGIVREAAGRLRATASSGGPDAETAGRALMELYAIAGEEVP